jgi:PAS domain S-box-containing protein
VRDDALGAMHLLAMVAGGSRLGEVLDGLCRLVEQSTPEAICSVVLVDAGSARVEHAAGPSVPETFAAAVHGRRLDPACGPCAMAALLDRQVIAEDLTTDTRWVEGGWNTLALAHELRACWSTPIRAAAGDVLGAFAIYYRTPRAPTTEHQAVIAGFTHVASIAIERSRAEAALRESRAQLARAQRLTATGSFSYLAASNTLRLSDEACRICGFELGATIAPETMRDRIHPEDLPTYYAMLAGPGTHFEYACRVVHPDGSLRHVVVLADAIRDAKGGLVEWVGAFRDVTDRRRADETLDAMRVELARAARFAAFGALTASIAHELNQPLSGLLTSANLTLRVLDDEPPGLAAAREAAQQTIRTAHRAIDVVARIRALFDPTRALTGPVDLNEAIREVLSLVAGELSRAGVSVRTELAADLPPLHGDRLQLQQVVQNLVANAAEAMVGVDGGARVVVVRTSYTDAAVAMAVEDTGPGFEPHLAYRLFDPLYTTKRTGMGMGLAISRSIVEGHRGKVWATSDSGGGARVGFTIPRAIDP